MKVVRFRRSVSYLKKCATKARTWLAVAARRFRAIRHTPDQSFPVGTPPASVISSDAPMSAPVSPHSSTRSRPISIDTALPMTPEHLTNFFTVASNSHSPTRSSLMSIDTGPLLTPDVLKAARHHTIAPIVHTSSSPPASHSPPITSFTSIPNIESSQSSMFSPPRTDLAKENPIQQLRDLHRLSPTPSFSRQSRLLTHASPKDSVPQLAARSPRPYAYSFPHDSPGPSSPSSYAAPTKQSILHSMRDGSQVQLYQHNELNISLPLVDFKKRRFSVLFDGDEHPVQPSKRYKMSSQVRLYMADIFPAPSSSRYHHGWFLDQNNAPVFWASCQPTTQSSTTENHPDRD
ncbi:uncharacterized protein MELLADRAFT_70086 [Melampsora larici-populina 98AG31]|uniref:Uncharacterized protein n=1 Tax=Melampsora larici-populina (strain 98AG31 / pathotype 3-4-7) TaxID=747676 RepID=F4SDI7_MELLP|nr:uncharacterized protein MELLADRAFT_70086 [Melampsora larici-populina 98AG31]EGF97289.1 hypothetical protein MELLADRAFT_70086 [Melampsora larici-populina 98AG31]